MPGPFIPDPTPAWLKPENASVTDSAMTKALRMIGHLIGADNPTSQVLALMAPLAPEGTEAGGLVGQVSKFIKAYHGSPHDFERFSMEKIGTGEGAQAYGHGLYFAEEPAVAEQYKRMLGNRAFKVGNRELVSPMGGSTRALDTQTRGENIATQALDDAFNAQSSSPAQFASNRLRQQARYYPEEAGHIQEALNVIAEWQKTGEVQKMGGKMYEVAIKADPESFLDWDKPLSQQPEKVRVALESAGILQPKAGWSWQAHQVTAGDVAKKTFGPSAKEGQWTAVQRNAGGDIQYHSGGLYHSREGADRIVSLRSTGEPPPATGQTLYHDLESTMRKPGAFPELTIPDRSAATRALKEAGIPGIKYLDQGSRAAGEGSHNYVVFDDKLVEILKKYGIAVPVIEGLRYKAQQQNGVLHQDQLQGLTQ